jgi:hypothetical protein
MGPTFLISDVPTSHSRSIDLIRASTQSGLLGELWRETLAQANSWQGKPLITPHSLTPRRDPEQANVGNRDYQVVIAVQERIITQCLAYLITRQQAYLADAIAQARAIMDESLWPDWRDMAHLTHPVDLRTGQLLMAIGLMINWVGDVMPRHDRLAIIDGAIKRGLEPCLQALQLQTNFLNPDTDRANNWLCVVVAGYGVAAMSISHLDKKWEDLALDSADRMSRYLNCYGPDGESNESMGYSTATRMPAMFFSIHRCWTAGKENRLAQWPFVQNCRWQMQFLLPGAIGAPFGDSHPARPINICQYASIADAASDPLIQWAYLAFRSFTPDKASNAWFELLTYNPSLQPLDPQSSGVPLAAAFKAYSAYIVSRSSWSQEPGENKLTVFSKAGNGNEIHGHHDIGSVCIYLDNHPVIIDPGIIVPVYPKDFWGPNRYKYYQASSLAHNVPQIDGKEVSRREADQAKIVDFSQSTHPALGPVAAWSLDLTPLYVPADAVHRAVIRVGPFVAVLDTLATGGTSGPDKELAIRWHSASPVTIDAQGRFDVPGSQGAILASRIISLSQSVPTFTQGIHTNPPPFDKTRIDSPITQKNEAWLQASCQGRKAVFVTLFARTQNPGDVRFTQTRTGHRITTPQAAVEFSFDGLALKADDGAGAVIVQINLASPMPL